MIEVLPGVWDTTSKLMPTRLFKWFNWSTRHYYSGPDRRAIDYGLHVRRTSEIVHIQGDYGIIKNNSYSFRSGQTSAAGMQFIPSSYDLVRVDKGDISTSGILTILMTVECGHKWRQGIEYLKSQIPVD